MATTVTVKGGQGLWAIAREHLPRASPAELQRAVAEIARTNRLDPSQPLTTGQRLTLPTHFAGTAGNDRTVADALARLGSAPAVSASPLATRIAAAQPRPLLALAPSLVAAPQRADGVVPLADIVGVPVRATVQRFEGVASSMGSAALATLDVHLGQLTQQQFDDVKASFGGRSRVHFDPARAYRAVDFLPPALQALVGQDLDRKDPVKLPGTATIGGADERRGELTIGLAPNCHGTSWEAARAFQGAATDSVALFYGEMIRHDQLTQDSALFRPLGTVPVDRGGDLSALGLQPGDIVQFQETGVMARASTMVVHSAVYVGNGLFFEKPNTEGADVAQPEQYRDHEETPYRLVDVHMMVDPVASAVRGGLSISAFRPVAPLPTPEQAFGSSFTAELEAYAKERAAILNTPLVVEYEQGMAGNIRGEHASALVRFPVRERPDGTSAIG
jgi:hypothetical protein